MSVHSTKTEPPIDAPDRRRLPPLLRKAWYGLNQSFRRHIAHAGATPDQFTVLRTLHEAKGGLTQSALTQAMSSDPNTVASLLDRMEKTGWLERRPHATDRRARSISLKPAGKRKYTELRSLAVSLQSKILAVLAESAREPFLEQLSLVADACRDAAEESSPGTKTPRARPRAGKRPSSTR